TGAATVVPRRRADRPGPAARHRGERERLLDDARGARIRWRRHSTRALRRPWMDGCPRFTVQEPGRPSDDRRRGRRIGDGWFVPLRRRARALSPEALAGGHVRRGAFLEITPPLSS